MTPGLLFFRFSSGCRTLAVSSWPIFFHQLKRHTRDEAHRLFQCLLPAAKAAQPQPTQAEAFAAIQELIEPSPLIHSTAISKGGVAVVVVENGWHYEPKQIRLQLATAIGQRWKEADPEGLGAITFVAIGGNEVGGRGFRGIWVVD